MSKRFAPPERFKEEIAKELGVYESVRKNKGLYHASSPKGGNRMADSIDKLENKISES